MKTKLSILILLLLLYHGTGLSQWSQMNSGTSVFLNSIGIYLNGTGYACGFGGLVLKTTNYGINWSALPPTSSGYLYSVHVQSSQTAYFSGADGDIIMTSNGGANWIHQTSNTTNTLRCVYFASSNIGVAAGDNGTIRVTTNGGTNWNHPSMDYTGLGNFYSVDMYNTSTGWVCGQDAGALIMKTTNGGGVWSLQNSGLDNHILRDIQFKNATTGVAVGDDGYIVRTTNGGTNWTSVNSGLTNDLHSIDVGSNLFSNYVWYVSGFGGKILQSTNDGASWVQLTSGTTNNLFEIDVVTASRDSVVVCGGQGIILRTTTGGIIPTAVVQTGNIIPENFELSQNYPNPFNPSTIISFAIAENSMVTLEVFDLLGRKVNELVNEELNSGTYSTAFDGSGLSSGVYFYHLNAVSVNSNFSKTMKLILTK